MWCRQQPKLIAEPKTKLPKEEQKGDETDEDGTGKESRAKGGETNIHLDHLGSVGICGWIKLQSAIERRGCRCGSSAVAALGRSITVAARFETSVCCGAPVLRPAWS